MQDDRLNWYIHISDTLVDSTHKLCNREVSMQNDRLNWYIHISNTLVDSTHQSILKKVWQYPFCLHFGGGGDVTSL